MTRVLLLVTLLPVLTACGGKGASTSVRVDPQNEAVVTFQGKRTFAVTISNQGPSPIEVLWPTRMLDTTLPPGSDSGQTIASGEAIRIRCSASEGSVVQLTSPRANGVRVQGTSTK